MTTGRFAPSPTGDLHLGNLRTALVAWLFARHDGGRFVLRMEDLDRAQATLDHEASQARDLRSMGLDWDGEVVRQSERFDRYEAALAQLTAEGRTYPCYCSRREIREAASAPHVPAGTYPGTCRDLGADERAARAQSGRPAAVRLRSDHTFEPVEDLLLGSIGAVVDDIVLRRNDGTPAYNLAVVVDDAAQGIDQVVRADDLVSSTPSQRRLARLLGLPPVAYAHVPLVLAPSGARLAKRDGAVTLAEQVALGNTPSEVVGLLAWSLGLVDRPEPVLGPDLLAGFDPTRIGREPWTFDPAADPAAPADLAAPAADPDAAADLADLAVPAADPDAADTVG